MKGNSKCALFLGAGFSAWAAGLPVVARLFDFQVSPNNRREVRRLARTRLEWDAWRSANPDEHPEAFVRFMLDASSAKASRISWYVTRRLSEPFIAHIRGGQQAFMIDDSRLRAHEGVCVARRFLMAMGPGRLSGILTLNYDLLAEYALGTGGFNYGKAGERLEGRNKNPHFFSQGGPVTVKGQLPLAKLHGSVSWDAQHRYSDGRAGTAGHALVVPPRREKAPPGELKTTWDLGARILSRSDQVVFFGFAFNPYDVAILDFLRDHAAHILTVDVIDIRPNTGQARTLFPHANIRTHSPPPASTVLDWVLTRIYV